MNKIITFLILVVLFATGVQTSYALMAVDNTQPARPTVQKFEFTTTMRYGMRNNNDVVQLQQFLIKKGYSTGKADGQFFRATQKAVMNLQRANGLTPDGIVGKGTRAILNGWQNSNSHAKINTYLISPLNEENPIRNEVRPMEEEQILFLGGGNEFTPTLFNDVYSSNNMSDWKVISTNDPTSNSKWEGRSRIESIYFKNKYWIVGGLCVSSETQTCNDIWSSVDGVSLTKISSSTPFFSYFNIELTSFKNRLYVIGTTHLSGGQQKIFSSEDGTNWSTITLPFSERGGAGISTFNGKLYFIGGIEDGTLVKKGDIWSSVDGENFIKEADNGPWEKISSAKILTLNGNAYLFGAVNDNGNPSKQELVVYKSPNGISWSHLGTTPFYYGSKVIVANGKILAGDNHSLLGSVNHLWYSSDGLKWTKVSNKLPWSPRSGYSLVSKNL